MAYSWNIRMSSALPRDRAGAPPGDLIVGLPGPVFWAAPPRPAVAMRRKWGGSRITVSSRVTVMLELSPPAPVIGSNVWFAVSTPSIVANWRVAP
eukprot:660091-Rhodomonas_salina.2